MQTTTQNKTTAHIAYDRQGYMIVTDDYTAWTAQHVAAIVGGTVRAYVVPVWDWTPRVPKFIG